MALNPNNQAQAGWKTIIAAASGAFVVFALIWILYLANLAPGL
jgi:hypothetical protein